MGHYTSTGNDSLEQSKPKRKAVPSCITCSHHLRISGPNGCGSCLRKNHYDPIPGKPKVRKVVEKIKPPTFSHCYRCPLFRICHVPLQSELCKQAWRRLAAYMRGR